MTFLQNSGFALRNLRLCGGCTLGRAALVALASCPEPPRRVMPALFAGAATLGSKVGGPDFHESSVTSYQSFLPGGSL
jgi:hypothetical protein